MAAVEPVSGVPKALAAVALMLASSIFVSAGEPPTTEDSLAEEACSNSTHKRPR